jgi:hypothetical protein
VRGLLLALLLVPACTQPPAAHRAEVVKLSPSTIQVVPAEGQPPFCLAYTASEKGVVRHLTSSAASSLECPARQPIGGVRYEIPKGEGKVWIYVIFSDKQLEAAPISAQVHEMGRGGGLTAMDLRAPGNVVLETLEFTPSG